MEHSQTTPLRQLAFIWQVIRDSAALRVACILAILPSAFILWKSGRQDWLTATVLFFIFEIIAVGATYAIEPHLAERREKRLKRARIRRQELHEDLAQIAEMKRLGQMRKELPAPPLSTAGDLGA